MCMDYETAIKVAADTRVSKENYSHVVALDSIDMHVQKLNQANANLAETAARFKDQISTLAKDNEALRKEREVSILDTPNSVQPGDESQEERAARTRFCNEWAGKIGNAAKNNDIQAMQKIAGDGVGGLICLFDMKKITAADAVEAINRSQQMERVVANLSPVRRMIAELLLS